MPMMAAPMVEGGRIVDVLIRMLYPRELAKAHSFPADYWLSGSQADQVKQIGNSVPVRTAEALCLSALTEGMKRAA
jgi:DNA (cytosine-5)-methyltransferase 1